MLSIHSEAPAPDGRGVIRREFLRIGGLAGLGFSMLDLARLRAVADPRGPASRHRGNSCVFIFLFGGPSHIDLWDLKPGAPAEIRGEFRPIATAVPGIEICEHLPLLARGMGRLCLLRSMTHRMPVHGPACSELYTGRPYPGPPITDQARPDDWPALSALVTRFGRRPGGLPPAVVLPWYTQFAGQDLPIAGQVGGRMGERYRPLLIAGDPSRTDFQVPGLRLPEELPWHRAEARAALLRRIEAAATRSILQGGAEATYRTDYQGALALLADSRAARAFDLEDEPAAVRERYGDGKFARSLLLARRLVEAEVPLVTVNYDDETRDDKVSPFWDTHDQNFPRIKQRLAPRFDRAFSAFLEDLEARGLLATTLVVASGEFGRTPRIGQRVQNAMTEKTGRDHWPHAFTALLAGGDVRGGQVFGATDAIGGHVKDDPVSPADLAATILHHLGLDPRQEYRDEFQQVARRLSDGNPIRRLS